MWPAEGAGAGHSRQLGIFTKVRTEAWTVGFGDRRYTEESREGRMRPGHPGRMDGSGGFSKRLGKRSANEGYLQKKSLGTKRNEEEEEKTGTKVLGRRRGWHRQGLRPGLCPEYTGLLLFLAGTLRLRMVMLAGLGCQPPGGLQRTRERRRRRPPVWGSAPKKGGEGGFPSKAHQRRSACTAQHRGWLGRARSRCSLGTPSRELRLSGRGTTRRAEQ